MKGISKDRLHLVKEELKRDNSYNEHDKDTLINLLDALISYSEELNPWLPIDDNTPKDRPLLLFYSDRTRRILSWDKDMGFDIYDAWLCKTITATRYQELPPDPIDTSIKK